MRPSPSDLRTLIYKSIERNRTSIERNRISIERNRISIESIEFYPEFQIRLIFDCARQSNRNQSIAFDCVRLIRLEFSFDSVRLTSSG